MNETTHIKRKKLALKISNNKDKWWIYKYIMDSDAKPRRK